MQEALANEPAPAGAAPDKLVIHVEGDAGGSWSMGFTGGKLAIDQGATAGAPLQVSMSTADLRSFIAGEVRDAIKAKAGGRGTIDAKQMAKLFRVTNKTEQVKAFSGDLQFRMEDAGKGKTYKITLTFGGGAPNVAAPKTTISMALSDFLALIGGELNPQAAFFAGQIRLDGDMNLAMGLMALAM
ncbi:MAG: SCP2 sterol-binding domain-containing protein [Myxococcota bacterium]